MATPLLETIFHLVSNKTRVEQPSQFFHLRLRMGQALQAEMKHIAITGASGFVGSRLCELKREVYRIDRVSLRNQTLDKINLDRVDTVIHLAGIAHRMEPPPDSLYYDVNHRLTLAFAEKAKSAGVQHFIFMSTTKVYSEHLENVSLATECEPNDAYGKSKLMAETALQQLNDDCFVVSIIRSPLIFGPGVKGNLRTLVDLCQNNRFVPLGGIKNRRSMVNVDNLIQLIDLLVSKRLPGTYLVQDKEPVSTSELAAQIMQALNSSSKLVTIPPFAQKMIYLIFPEKAKRLLGSFVVDDTETRKKLQYTPQIPFEAGIESMVKE